MTNHYRIVARVWCFDGTHRTPDLHYAILLVDEVVLYASERRSVGRDLLRWGR